MCPWKRTFLYIWLWWFSIWLKRWVVFEGHKSSILCCSWLRLVKISSIQATSLVAATTVWTSWDTWSLRAWISHINSIFIWTSLELLGTTNSLRHWLGSIVDPAKFIRSRLHLFIILVLINCKLGLVDACLGIESILVKISLLIKLLIDIGSFQEITFDESLWGRWMLAIPEWVDGSETRWIHPLSKGALEELIYTWFWRLLLLGHLLYSDSISAVWHSLRGSHYSPLVGILENRGSFLLHTASSSVKLWALYNEWVSWVGASSSFCSIISAYSGSSRSRAWFCGCIRFTSRFDISFFGNSLWSLVIVLLRWSLALRVSWSLSTLFRCCLLGTCGFIFFDYLIHFFHSSHFSFRSLLGSAGASHVLHGSGIFVHIWAGVALGWVVVHILFWFKLMLSNNL